MLLLFVLMMNQFPEPYTVTIEEDKKVTAYTYTFLKQGIKFSYASETKGRVGLVGRGSTFFRYGEIVSFQYQFIKGEKQHQVYMRANKIGTHGNIGFRFNTKAKAMRFLEDVDRIVTLVNNL